MGDVHVPVGLWLATVVGVMGVAAVVMIGLWRGVGDRGSAAPGTRSSAAALVGAWLLVDVVLGAAGAFEASPDNYVPLIAIGIAAPIGVGVWLLGRAGPMGDYLRSFPTSWLVGVQLYRAVGAIFLLGWALGVMPGTFALPAGIGDVAVGLVAPFVALRIHRADPGAHRAAITWNLVGLADLVIAVTLGFLTSPSPFQLLADGDPNSLISRFPLVLVPVFAVPLSILFHIAALRRLTGAPAMAARTRRISAGAGK